MTDRAIVATELARFFGCLSNPLRVQIVEELGSRELTVNDLQNALQVPHASVSQHLAVLRANRIVVERREGRYVFYHLRIPALAEIVRECLRFVQPDQAATSQFMDALVSARQKWETSNDNRSHETENADAVDRVPLD